MGHMDMGSLSMSGMDMSMTGMDMPTGTGSMSMSSSTGMGDMGDMGHMDGMHLDMDMHGGMPMYFSTYYKNRVVLFKNFQANNNGQAFGIFLLIFFVGFLGKGLEFLKNYLEVRVWNNPNYQRQTTVVDECACDDDLDKTRASLEVSQVPRNHSIVNVVVRDIIRISLCFLSEMIGYALMLIAMSFSLVYFFAAVLGNAVGRYFFERLSDRFAMMPTTTLQGHH